MYVMLAESDQGPLRSWFPDPAGLSPKAVVKT